LLFSHWIAVSSLSEKGHRAMRPDGLVLDWTPLHDPVFLVVRNTSNNSSK
jgi:hypothetical protein